MVPFASGRAYAKPDMMFDPDVVPPKPYTSAILSRTSQKLVAQALAPEGHGIITDLADPGMGWVESEANITYRINANLNY